MNRRSLLAPVCLAAASLAALGAWTQPARDQPAKDQPAGQPQLPPGWTESDMQACIEAGTPGEQHRFLARQIGVWRGKSQMSMVPGADAITSECTNTITSVLDGRYIRSDLAGEFPGMGPFTGQGIAGFDNVSQKFVGSWIDNHSTGIMQGTGALSAGGKALTWTYSYNCPIRKKPASVREVHTFTGADTMTFEMYTTDPKSGTEFQCMRIDFTRKSS